MEYLQPVVMVFSIIGIVPVMMVGIVTVVRYFVDGNWHRRYLHECGFHERFNTSPCARCGEDDGIWLKQTMRATFFWGWKTRK